MSNKGLETFLDVVSVLSNPEKYKNFIDELKSETAKYQQVIESVVELSKVSDYTKSIAEKEKKTQELLSQAKVKANSMMDNAKKEALITLAKSPAYALSSCPFSFPSRTASIVLAVNDSTVCSGSIPAYPYHLSPKRIGFC